MSSNRRGKKSKNERAVASKRGAEAKAIKKSGLLSASALKIIAIVAMAIDHVGAFLFPHIIWLRWVGRLTFPIMAFFVYEGWLRTRDIKRYAIRLAAFALVSELPFNLARTGSFIDLEGRNIGFTLLLGLGAIEFASRGGMWIALSAASCLLGDLLMVDYGTFGVLTVLMFFIFDRVSVTPLASVAVSCALLTYDQWPQVLPYISLKFPASYRYIPAQSFAIFTIPLLMMYNGKRGNSPGWLFYLFYPGHLLVLYAFGDQIRTLLAPFL